MIITGGVMLAVAERLRRTYPAPLGRAGVGSIPAIPDALNVPSFRRWRFEMKLSPLFFSPHPLLSLPRLGERDAHAPAAGYKRLYTYRDVVAYWSWRRAGNRLIASSNPTPAR